MSQGHHGEILITPVTKISASIDRGDYQFKKQRNFPRIDPEFSNSN